MVIVVVMMITMRLNHSIGDKIINGIIYASGISGKGDSIWLHHLWHCSKKTVVLLIAYVIKINLLIIEKRIFKKLLHNLQEVAHKE